MEIPFYKYQGTGNDFVMIDERSHSYFDPSDSNLIASLCDRKFGIGADGLILLANSSEADFKMIYFNADGKPSTMCGNGGRCLVHFAWSLGVFQKKTRFEAIDGIHTATVLNDGNVELQMSDVPKSVQLNPDTFEINTGSPHYISICDQLPDNIREAGAAIRYSVPYRKEGINVNFLLPQEDYIEVATYERGVEDETLSCGTGVTASAMATAIHDHLYGKIEINVKTKGGDLTVSFKRSENDVFTDVFLTGPAKMVYQGIIKI